MLRAVSGGAVHEEHAGHERVLADDQVLIQVVVVVVARPRALHLRATIRQQFSSPAILYEYTEFLWVY